VRIAGGVDVPLGAVELSRPLQQWHLGAGVEVARLAGLDAAVAGLLL
jgi:hypothetical protein